MSNNTIHSPEELLPGEGEALTWEEASEYGLTIDPVEAAEAREGVDENDEAI